MKLKRIINLRMVGDDVKFLQTKLKEQGFFNESIDGNFGQNTLIAVANFQRANGMKADGVVGSLTWNRIINNQLDIERAYYENKVKTLLDIPYNASYISNDGLVIYDYLLKESDYISDINKKESIWLHHTSGGSRPDWTIDGWENGTINKKSAKIGSAYVIGRRSSSSNISLWDGKVLRAFDDKYTAYHIGSDKKLSDINYNSIGIEICNYGPLKLGKDGRFYNYINKPIFDEDVVKLDKPFRGYQYFEKYTDAQIESTQKLIKYLINRHAITIQGKIYTESWFDFNEDLIKNKGIRSHSQVKNDIFDIFPQREMIDMLNSF